VTLLAALVTGIVLAASACGGASPVAEEANAAAGVSTDTATAVETEAVPPPAERDTDGLGDTDGLVYSDGAREGRFARPLTARAYIAIDAETGEVLIARRDRQRLPIASLTKTMTALLAIEQGRLAKKIQVPEEATRVEPNKEGLVANRWYPRKLLLYSAMLESANDSAYTLAVDAGDGSLARFYRRADARARTLGMTDTRYRSPNGLNDDTNVSSARDQAILGREALRNRTFAAIVRTKTKSVEWPPPTYRKEWVNHNDMLWTYKGTYGIKTGWTTRAGGCLATAVRRNGHEVIAVVLASDDIWSDMSRLVDRAFAEIDR
jgi:D-alanyl-D-alanine carboxypeptidase